MCSKVLNGHIILTDTSITTILAPEMTYTPRFFDGADGFGKGDAGETGRDPLLRSPALAECYPSPQDEQEGNEEKS